MKEGCCDNCYKKCYWCFLNCVCCNIPSCSQDCNKCIAKYCCTPPFERRHFGMTQLTMTVPLTDVIQVTSTTRVSAKHGELLCCLCHLCLLNLHCDACFEASFGARQLSAPSGRALSSFSERKVQCSQLLQFLC